MKILITIGLAVALTTGCSNLSKGERTVAGAGIGIVTGAILGGVIGHQSGKKKEGTLIGGAVGGIIGGVAGNKTHKDKPVPPKSEERETIKLREKKLIEVEEITEVPIEKETRKYYIDPKTGKKIYIKEK